MGCHGNKDTIVQKKCFCKNASNYVLEKTAFAVSKCFDGDDSKNFNCSVSSKYGWNWAVDETDPNHVIIWRN